MSNKNFNTNNNNSKLAELHARRNAFTKNVYSENWDIDASLQNSIKYSDNDTLFNYYLNGRDDTSSEDQKRISNFARAEIIERYIPLVNKVAKKTIKNVNDDIIACGIEGLRNALVKYNPNNGKLESFAWNFIKGSILDYQAANKLPYNISKHQYQKFSDIDKVKEQFIYENNHNPSNWDLENSSDNVSKNTFSEHYYTAQWMSLDKTFDTDDYDSASFHEVIAYDNYENEFNNTFRKQFNSAISNFMKLNAIEQKVIALNIGFKEITWSDDSGIEKFIKTHYGNCERTSVRLIAKSLNKSVSEINKIKKSALEKLAS